jgi:23S rRNA pseudouridine2605 synthase
MPEESFERLQKVLAHAGVASRRNAETMIREGRVTVNGEVVTELGTRVDTARDDIRVDGERVKLTTGHTYLLLNKPRGVLSVMEDDRGRRALGDLVQHEGRLYPVGRLDVNSEGLILLTDDGELANVLTHPRYGHEKEYRELVNGHPSEKTLEAWRRGVVLEGERTAPADVEIVRHDREGALLRVVMHEGRKRQIRDVAALLGHPVRELRRVRIGPLELGTLESGQVRPLTAAEVKAVQSLVRQPAGKGRTGQLPKARTAAQQGGHRAPSQGAGHGYPSREPGHKHATRAVGHGRTAREIEREETRERSRGERLPKRAGRGGPPGRSGASAAAARGARPAEAGRGGAPEQGERERAPMRPRRGGPARRSRTGASPDSATGAGERERGPKAPRRGGPPRRGRTDAPPDAPTGAGERERGPKMPRRGGPPRRGRTGAAPERGEREGSPAKGPREERDEGRRGRYPDKGGRRGPSRPGRSGGPAGKSRPRRGSAPARARRRKPRS